MAKKGFSIAATLKGVNGAGPILKGLGQIRSVGITTGKALRGALSLGTKALTLGGLVGGGSLGGLALTVKRLTDSQAEAIQMSARYAAVMKMPLGVMQQWEYAANRADVPVGEFHQALASFAEAGGQIETGVGRSATALKRMSPSLFKHLRDAATPTDRLRVALTALGDTRVSYGVRVLTAGKLFGGQGEGMVRLAEMGRVEIERQMAAAKKWGLNSEDAVRKQEEYEEATKDLDAAFTGLKRTVGEAVMPLVSKYTTQLAGWTQSHRDLIALKVAEWVDRGAKALDAVVEHGPAVVETLSNIGAAVEPIARGFSLIGEGVKTLSGWYEKEADYTPAGTTKEELQAAEREVKGEGGGGLGLQEAMHNKSRLPWQDEAPTPHVPGTHDYKVRVANTIRRNRANREWMERPTLDQVLSGQSVARAPIQYSPAATAAPARAQIEVLVQDDRVRVRPVRQEGNVDVSADVGMRSDLGDGDEE